MLKIYALLKRRAVQFSSILTNATGLYPVAPVNSPRTSRLVHHGVAGRSVAPRVLPPFGYAIHRRPSGLTALIAGGPRVRSSSALFTKSCTTSYTCDGRSSVTRPDGAGRSCGRYPGGALRTATRWLGPRRSFFASALRPGVSVPRARSDRWD